MFHWLSRPKLKAPDGKYTYHIIPVPNPGTQEWVFDREFQDPIYPLVGGAGKLAQRQILPLQPPQVFQTAVSSLYGPGGIPSPDQTFDLQGLEDNSE